MSLQYNRNDQAPARLMLVVNNNKDAYLQQYRGTFFTVYDENEVKNKAITFINGIQITFKPRLTLSEASQEVKNFIDLHLDSGGIHIG